MKKTLLTLITLIAVTTISAQKYVGGDLSLVPAYEEAGDKWLDAEGSIINTKYSDGMITYVHEVAEWNAVRVRLLVDPSQDDAPATCQDLEYVKKLGKRIKDAGMNFLLDIFYSDTWTDVSQQWIPTSWNMNRNTATETLATQVKNYTIEVLNELTAYGAQPDFVQIGNEVSYGMLWDNLAGKNNSTHFFNLSTGYEAQSTKINRFATLLKAAAEGVRASNSSTAKIVLHCERTINSNQVKNFYTWVQQAGFTDYDVIGLSYYPLWHGTLSNLKTTLNTLQNSFPTKEIQIVETGYYHTDFTPKAGETDTRSTWPYSPSGQAAFLQDLIAALKSYSSVTGLYYWQPEECGNGADENGNNRVMGNWDNRGFWEISWKSGNHALNSKNALMTLKTFVSENADDQPTDVTAQYIVNASFDSNINGWTNIGGTAKWKQNTWAPLSNYCEFAWTGNAIVNQEVVQSPILPVGSYKLSVNCASDNGSTGVLLIAGDQSKEMAGTGNIETATVDFSVSSEEPVKLGVKLQNTTATWVNFDNFTLLKEETSGIEIINREPLTVNQHAWYTLDGRKLNGKPNRRGIYIYNGKKMVVG
jgi:arabinogalactan endo-1,4-beta-galactosidase